MGFIENWQSGENALGRFLAETKTGTFVKAVITPVLVLVGEGISDSTLNPFVQVGLYGAIPVLINILNPADKRMGITGPKDDQDG